MKALLCDSGPLIATSDRADRHHVRCTKLLAAWPGTVLIPEPVLGETCNFLRNHVRHGSDLEAAFLESMVSGQGSFELTNPIDEDRARAAELVRRLATAPLGYVDAIVIAMAERLAVTDVATTDLKLVGMAQSVTKIRPLAWPFQENDL